jgi:hypothetical protein
LIRPKITAISSSPAVLPPVFFPNDFDMVDACGHLREGSLHEIHFL